MKAALIIDMPEACTKCRLCVSGSCAGRDWYESNTTEPLQTERAPFCPLKPMEEIGHMVTIGENGTAYCPGCKHKIGAFRGRNYFPDCGVRLTWLDWGGEIYGNPPDNPPPAGDEEEPPSYQAQL